MWHIFQCQYRFFGAFSRVKIDFVAHFDGPWVCRNALLTTRPCAGMTHPAHATTPGLTRVQALGSQPRATSTRPPPHDDETVHDINIEHVMHLIDEDGAWAVYDINIEHVMHVID